MINEYDQFHQGLQKAVLTAGQKSQNVQEELNLLIDSLSSKDEQGRTIYTQLINGRHFVSAFKNILIEKLTMLADILNKAMIERAELLKSKRMKIEEILNTEPTTN